MPAESPELIRIIKKTFKLFVIFIGVVMEYFKRDLGAHGYTPYCADRHGAARFPFLPLVRFLLLVTGEGEVPVLPVEMGTRPSSSAAPAVALLPSSGQRHPSTAGGEGFAGHEAGF